MSIPTQLTVVNGCLATMGESPLNELEPNHPYVQVALLALDRGINFELSRGWWFNKDEVQLLPDSFTGYVAVPADALDLETAYTQLVHRGTRLYDRKNGAYDLRDFMALEGLLFIESLVTRAIPFEDLPTMAKHLVALRTQLDFQSSYDADAQRYGELAVQYKSINATMRSQDIRNSKVNVLRSPGVMEKLSRISPMSSGMGGLKRWSRNG